jgi:Uma2 family endonuclease
MGAAAEKLRMSEADYLDWESRAKEKHEYVAGEIFAMAGASERHNRIAGNIFFHLRQATRGHSCRAFMSDMKLRIAGHRSYYYPDVMLVCDDSDNHPIYKTAPCFIAEVLSPSTATTDQREKWLHYQDIPSLRYYLLVDADHLNARLLTRVAEDRWTEQILDREDIVEIACGDARLALSLDDLYEDTGLLTT